jgi:ABC-type transport system involved in multi-copper enzyme maturation permease subunit
VIRVVATATCREAIRSRAFLGLVIIYLVAVAGSRIVGWISSTDGNIVTANLVMTLQSVLGVLVAVATGTMLVHSEVQQKTLYTVLSRPLPRWRFVVGKYAGLALALALGQAAMVVIGLGYLALTGAEVTRWLAIAGALTLVEVLVMAAVSLCVTSLTSPLLATVICLAVYFLGHAVASLPELIHYLKGWQQDVAVALAGLVPNLGMFTFRDKAIHGHAITVADAARSLGYGALWIALLVTITVAVFRRKQL